MPRSASPQSSRAAWGRRRARSAARTAGSSSSTADGLYVASRDAVGQTRLPRARTIYVNASWSPDGTKLVAEHVSNGNVDLYLLDGLGRRLRRLTDARGFDGDATWSPEGAWIAYESDASGDREVWLGRVAGRSRWPLTQSPGFDGDPAFSPNGGSIAFTSERGGGSGGTSIFVMNRAGSGVRRLTPPNAAAAPSFFRNPSRSPDARTIAFDGGSGDQFDVFAMNFDGTGRRRLADRPGLDALPAWSPDGRWIAFLSDRGGRLRVWVMRPNGESPQVVNRIGEPNAPPDWQRLGPRPRGCTISGTTGNDLLAGTPARDVVCGGPGDDVLWGHDGHDHLDGGFDHDHLDGGRGDDSLVGGPWPRRAARRRR